MYDVGLGDWNTGFEIGRGTTEEERNFWDNLLDNIGLYRAIIYKNVYSYCKKEKYVEFCFRIQWYSDFAKEMFIEGTRANGFFKLCCKTDDKDEVLKKELEKGGPIFITSKVFSIDNWKKEAENLVGLVI